MFTCLDLLAPLISDPRRPFAVTSSRMGSSAPGAGRQVGPGRWRRRAGMDQGGRRDSPARWCRLIPRHLSGSRRSADVATNSSPHLLLGQDVTSLNNILDVWIGDTCQIQLVDVPFSLVETVVVSTTVSTLGPTNVGFFSLMIYSAMKSYYHSNAGLNFFIQNWTRNHTQPHQWYHYHSHVEACN